MADQTTMASSKAGFRVPPEMLSFAEQSVEQAKKAFDSVMTAAKSAASAIEGQTIAAQAGAKDMQRKAVAFAEHNVDASFDFATRLLAAKDGEEVMKLHADYVKRRDADAGARRPGSRVGPDCGARHGVQAKGLKSLTLWRHPGAHVTFLCTARYFIATQHRRCYIAPIVRDDGSVSGSIEAARIHAGGRSRRQKSSGPRALQDSTATRG